MDIGRRARHTLSDAEVARSVGSIDIDGTLTQFGILLGGERRVLSARTLPCLYRGDREEHDHGSDDEAAEHLVPDRRDARQNDGGTLSFSDEVIAQDKYRARQTQGVEYVEHEIRRTVLRMFLPRDAIGECHGPDAKDGHDVHEP